MCSLGITDLCPHWPSGSVGAYCMPLFSSTLTGASLWLSILVLWVVPCSVALVGSSLSFFGGCLLLLGCLPLLARVSSVASLFLPLHWALGCAASSVCGCLPLPLGCSRVASWPNQASAVLVSPWYLVASCDGLVALPVAWSVVVLCFLASCCSTAAKAFGPVWGDWFTSTPCAYVAVGFALLH